MKKNTVKIISCILALAVILCAFASCGTDNQKNVMLCKDSEGKVSASADQKLLSLVMAVVNYQLGADALEDEMWDMEFQEGNDTTVRQIVVEQSKAYAEGLLQAQYLCDVVYEIGLSDEQKDSVKAYIDDVANVYGSEKNLENALSVYGADVSTLEQYMELVLKQDTLYSNLYGEEGLRQPLVDQNKPAYFEQHFAIADHILIKYSGGVKDDGTEIPLSQEEIEAKRETAKSLYNGIAAGALDFDETLAEYNEDTYKLGYPFGYFIPDTFYWTGISTDVQDAVLEMETDEIRFVDTPDGAYIIRRNEMDSSLYASNGNFEAYIETMLAQEDFLDLCDSACTIEVDEELLSELNPALIPSFNIDTLGA